MPARALPGEAAPAEEAIRPGSSPPPVHADAPPPGHTGGFGEPTCRECHDELPLNEAGTLTVEGMPEAYAPGRTYVVTLSLVSDGMERAGFQVAVRFAEGPRAGESAGALEPVDERVVTAEGETGVTYAQHAPGADWTGGETAAWSLRWTAPHAPAPVVLHAAANSANGDDSPLGDIVYTVEARSQPR